MKKASVYYRDNAARHGGYVYYYSPDFQRRLGEGVAEKDEIWVQPPGTPTVGSAWLAAYLATNDPFYLDAALETADALIYGQLQSGAWTNSINFDPVGNRVAQYRNGKGKGKNFSTLDDDISQSAIQFLIELDNMTQFQNKKVHEAATVALDALLAAQFPNGAFPQGWDETPAVGAMQPGKKGNFPKYDWKTEGRIKEYWHLYTLNDGVAATVADTLLVAYRIYQKQEYEDALRRLGEFLIEAQMPAPQPAWAQQYNYEMQPVWARKFEPPAIASRESETAIATLLKIAVHFRDKRFLEPIPAALDYLESSELPCGRLARYYELQSNKPLYMERSGKQYSLTHSDKNLPSHYGWQNPSRVADLRSAWSAVQQRRGLPSPVLPSMEKAPPVDEILRSLDDDGRWMSTYHGELLVGQPKFQDGEKYLNSAVFSRNLTILSSFLRSGAQ
ncbi:MAG: pectate lyase [Verrucomicrobiales bacterium]|nr:pectate lyase [Verrucomicrobiales bacterium]